MPASKDPKSYVRPVPLPIPSCTGLRLLARDTINFNPENPTREEVRKNNYNRRQTQMLTMGFKSANHRPYIGIGDPFYLDEKKMILHALGQWTEELASTSSSSDESDDDDDAAGGAPKPAFTAAKFVLRRSRKDLNTLNKAVVHGRNMIRNVSLGHGFFDLINKQKKSKKEASELAIKKRREMLRNEFQPPKNDSDVDSEDEVGDDVDLSNYMVPVAPPTFLTQMQQMDTDEELGIVNDNGSDSDQSPEREPEIVTFTGMALAEHEEEYQRAMSAMVTSELTTYSRPVSRRKKKQETPRPYTPQHTNLSANISLRESAADSEQDVDVTKDALFRQLCVLHWILEAMSTDPPSAMSPIMSCWSLTDIGGSRAQPKKLLRDKATESGWTNFLSKDTSRVSKRLSTQRLATNRSAHARRPLHTTGRNSVHSSVGGSQPGSTTGHGNGHGHHDKEIKHPLHHSERGQSPSLVIAAKMANLFKARTTEEPPPPTSLVPTKLASLLKPKLTGDQKDLLTNGNNNNNSNDGQINTPTKQNNLDHVEPIKGSNETVLAPIPTSKLGALFNRKVADVSESKSPTPPNMIAALKPGIAETKSKSPIPTKILVTKDASSNCKSTPAPKQRKLKSLSGEAASLGQFLELKMRGGLNTLTGHMAMLGVRNDDLSPRVEEEEDQMYNKSIFKFLDEYYESLKTEEDANGKKGIENKSPSSTPPTTPTPEKKVKSDGKKKKRKKEEAENKEKRLDHKVAVALGEEENMASKYLRANAHLIRPMSSPALTEFQAGLPSSKKVTLCADLHNQFAETREEKALTLHDILDHKESQRMSVCQSKFVSLQGMRHGSSFHRAVEDMRSQSWQRMRKPINDRKKSTAKGNWYTDLMEKIPPELRQEWFYAKILQKLGNFGLVEGTGKQSIYKFIKILEGLREWEICSPDITAAIEFCRERIVEMTVEEYESWFTQRFPKITRPQTAPAGMKGGEKKNESFKSPSKTPAIMNKRPSQSAFTRRAQH